MKEEQSNLSQISRQRIKMIRKERGMTLEQVANQCGVLRSTVRKWEEGMIATIKFEHMQKLAEIFRVSIAWLMGMNVPMETETDEHRSLRNELSDMMMFMSLADLKKLEVLMKTMFEK